MKKDRGKKDDSQQNVLCLEWNGTAADSLAQWSCGEHVLQRNQRVIHVNKSSTIAGCFLGEPVQAKLKKRLQNDVNSCVQGATSAKPKPTKAITDSCKTRWNSTFPILIIILKKSILALLNYAIGIQLPMAFFFQ